MDLLVAVEVYQLQVGPLIRSASAFGMHMMAVEGFSVEEGSSSMATTYLLGVCQTDEPGRQLFDVCRINRHRCVPIKALVSRRRRQSPSLRSIE